MRASTQGVIFIALIAVIVGIIVLINIAKSNGLDEETAKCVAEKSKLFVSKTCHYCADQKKIIGRHIGYFELIDVAEHPEVWDEYGLLGVPTWIIDDVMYPELKSAEQLKEITGC